MKFEPLFQVVFERDRSHSDLEEHSKRDRVQCFFQNAQTITLHIACNKSRQLETTVRKSMLSSIFKHATVLLAYGVSVHLAIRGGAGITGDSIREIGVNQKSEQKKSHAQEGTLSWTRYARLCVPFPTRHATVKRPNSTSL